MIIYFYDEYYTIEMCVIIIILLILSYFAVLMNSTCFISISIMKKVDLQDFENKKPKFQQQFIQTSLTINFINIIVMITQLLYFLIVVITQLLYLIIVMLSQLSLYLIMIIVIIIAIVGFH